MEGKTSPTKARKNAQGMVEFALVLPVLLLVLFGIIEFGRLLFIYVTTTSASREAARYGTAVGGNANDLPRYRDCDGMRAAAKKVGILANLRDEDIFIWYDYGPGATSYGFDCAPNVDVPLGSRVVVQVRTPFSPIVPMTPININQVEAVSARTIVKDISVGVAAAPPPPPDPNPPPFVSFELSETLDAREGTSVDLNIILRDANGNPTFAPEPITIYFVSNGEAEEGADYTLSANPLVIDRNRSGGTLTVQIIDDGLYEANESFDITIVNIANGRYGSPLTHTITILNENPPPVMAFRLASSTLTEKDPDDVTNGLVGRIEVGIEVRLNVVSGLPAYANLSLMGGTATSGQDYELTSSALVEIPAGAQSVFVLLEVIGDLMDEDDETVILTLFNPVSATLGATRVHTLTILDDDDPPTVSFSVAAQKVPEAIGEAEVLIELSQPSGKEIRVPFTISANSTAVPVTDYVLATTSPVIIPPGQAAAEIVVNVVSDTDYLEPDETVIFVMGTPVNATRTTPSTHTLTITEEPTVWFATRQQSVSEGAGMTTVTVRLAPPAKEPVSVPFTLSGTAAQGSDYTITSSPLSIPIGGTSATITVNIIDDTLYEENETLLITLGKPANAEVGSPSVHTITILENDPMPRVSFTEANQRVIENAGSATITARLSGASSRNVTIPYTVSGTATRGVDYTIPSGPAVITAGNLSTNINVTIISDDDYTEPDETVIVSMGQPTNATLAYPSEHVLTIASPVCPSAPVNPAFGSGNESKKLSWNIQNSRLAPAKLLQVNITWPSSQARLDEVKFGVDPIGETHLFPARDGVLNITTPSPLWEGDFYTATLTFVFSTNLKPSDGMISVLASFENCPPITGFYGQ